MTRSPPRPPPDSTDVTALLQAWPQGDTQVEERLLRAVYTELHRQAVRAMRRESPDHTLQPTALVHEAYLRLVDQRRVEWQSRAHFFGVAAQLMRRILVDHARGRLSAKRGGGMHRISLGDEIPDASDVACDESADILALHEAIEHLATFDAEQARLVELRYFGGLTIAETAEALNVSPATVKREWAVARAWLRRELDTA